MWHRMHNMRTNAMKWLVRRGMLTACYMFALSSCRGCKEEDFSTAQISLGELVFQLIESNIDDPDKRKIMRQDKEPLVASIDYVAGNTLPEGGAPGAAMHVVQPTAVEAMTSVVHGAVTSFANDEAVVLPESTTKSGRGSFFASDKAVTLPDPTMKSGRLSLSRNVVPTTEKRVHEIIRLINERQFDRMFKSLSRIFATVGSKALKPLGGRFAFINDYFVHQEVQQLHDDIEVLIRTVQRVRTSQDWSEAVAGLSQTIERMLPADGANAQADGLDLTRWGLRFVRRPAVRPLINSVFAGSREAEALITSEDLDLMEQMELELVVLQRLIKHLSPKQWQDLIAVAADALHVDGATKQAEQTDSSLAVRRTWDMQRQKQIFKQLRKTRSYRLLLQQLPTLLPGILKRSCSSQQQQELLWDRAMQLMAVIMHQHASKDVEQVCVEEMDKPHTEVLSVQQQVDRATKVLDSLPQIVAGTEEMAKVLVRLKDTEFDLLLRLASWLMQSGYVAVGGDPVAALQLFVTVRDASVYKDVLQLVPMLFNQLSRLPESKQTVVVERLLGAALSLQQSGIAAKGVSRATMVQRLQQASEVVALLLQLQPRHYDFVLQFVARTSAKHWDALLKAVMSQANHSKGLQFDLSLSQLPRMLDDVLALRSLYEKLEEPALEFVHCQRHSCPDTSEQQWTIFKETVAHLWPIAMSEGADREGERNALFSLLNLLPDAKLIHQLYDGDVAAQNQLRQVLTDAAANPDLLEFVSKKLQLIDLRHAFRVVVRTLTAEKKGRCSSKQGEEYEQCLDDLSKQLKQMDDFLLSDTNWGPAAVKFVRDNPSNGLATRFAGWASALSPTMQHRAMILVDILDQGKVTDDSVRQVWPRLHWLVKPQLDGMLGNPDRVAFSDEPNEAAQEKQAFKRLLENKIGHDAYVIFWQHLATKARNKQLLDTFFAITKKRFVNAYDWLWPTIKPSQQDVKLVQVALPQTLARPVLQLPKQSPWLALTRQADVRRLLAVASLVVQDIGQGDEGSVIRVALDLKQELAKAKYDWNVWEEIAQRKNADALAETLLWVLMDREYMPVATFMRTGFKVMSPDGTAGLLERMTGNLSRVFASEGLVEFMGLVRKIFPPPQPLFSSTPVSVHLQQDFINSASQPILAQ